MFEPLPQPATERVGPVIGIRVGTECLLSCDAQSIVLSDHGSAATVKEVD